MSKKKTAEINEHMIMKEPTVIIPPELDLKLWQIAAIMRREKIGWEEYHKNRESYVRKYFPNRFIKKKYT